LGKPYGRPGPKAVERDMGYLVEEIPDLLPENRRFVLRRDEHPACVRAIARLLGFAGRAKRGTDTRATSSRWDHG